LVELNAVCVVVGVSAPHRAAAFEACRHGIDALKRDVTIWKRETYEDGEVWVTNHA
jgi:molybdopterin synthase catalytic subunit